MEEAFVGVFIVIAVAIGAFIGFKIEHGDRENYKISCLELNLGKETCDKIFNQKDK